MGNTVLTVPMLSHIYLKHFYCLLTVRNMAMQNKSFILDKTKPDTNILGSL